MGIVQDIVSGIAEALINIILSFIEVILLNPLESFVGDLMVLLQDIIVGTPYPHRELGEPYPAVTQEPADEPWVTLYDFHQDIFQPYAYLLLFLTMLTVVFVDIVGSSLSIQIDAQLTKAKKKFFNAFLLITFWWYIGTLILSASDALTALLMSSVNSGSSSDAVGLEAVWTEAMDELDGDATTDNTEISDISQDSSTSASQLLMIPLILLWIAEGTLLLTIATLWIVRMVILFVLMPIMPIFISLWVMHIPGFDGLQDTGKMAMKWFVSLAFVTLPAAIVIAVAGEIVGQLFEYSDELSGSSNNQLSGYDTNKVIDHPQVGADVYGDGVSGLGGANAGQLDQVGGFAATIFALLLVAAVPFLAGLAPLIMFKSEAGTLVQSAVNPAAGAASAASSMTDSVKSGASMAKDVKNRDFDSLNERFEDQLGSGDIGQKMKNNPGALFGAASAKMAGKTQDRAGQLKDGASEIPGAAASGMSRIDDAQMIIREHRGEVADIAYENTKETAKKHIDPAKRQAQAVSLANKPGDAKDAFKDKVSEQQNYVNNVIENRRKKKQRFADMSTAELRSALEVENYTPDEDDLDVLLEQDDSVLKSSRKSGMINEVSMFREQGYQSREMAEKSMTAMEESIRDGLKGTAISPDPYVSEIAEYRRQVRAGEMSPEEAMDTIKHVEERMKSDIQSDEQIKQKYREMEEQYDKYQANMSSGEYAAQSLSIAEMNDLPGLEEVIGGYAIRDNRAREALEETGLDPDNYDIDELKENPDKLARLVGAETFNDLEVSDKFEAVESLNRDGAKRTDFSEDELDKYDVSDLQQAIENESNSDLDAGKASSMFADEDMDRVELSSWDSDDFSNTLLSDLNELDSDTSLGELDNDWDMNEVFDSLGLGEDEKQTILNLDDDTDISETKVGQQVQAAIKSEMTKEVGKAHGKAARELAELKGSLAEQAVVAQEEYAAELMREMVENAPSQEAAVTLLESQKGALMEEAGVDPQELDGGLDEETREEFVRDIVEQQLSGEEIESAISQRFHEEFDDTTEMLENIEEIQDARNIVKDVDEALGDENIESLIDESMSSMSTEELFENPDGAAQQMMGETLTELQKLEGGEIDEDTLDTFDVDIDEKESIVADDEKSVLQEKARNEAIESVESKIESEFGVTASEIGYDEITSENIGDIIKDAAVEKQTKNLEKKLQIEQMSKAREESEQSN